MICCGAGGAQDGRRGQQVAVADERRQAAEGWGIPTLPPFNGDLDLSWPEGDCPVAVVPICINAVQFPLPSAKRVYALGRAVWDAIRSWDSDKRVAAIASGGLSHQLDGERAGFINKAFDLQFLVTSP